MIKNKNKTMMDKSVEINALKELIENYRKIGNEILPAIVLFEQKVCGTLNGRKASFVDLDKTVWNNLIDNNIKPDNFELLENEVNKMLKNI